MRNSPDDLFTEGTEALQAGDLPAALALLRQCRDVAPQGSRTRADAGNNLIFALTQLYNTGKTDAVGTRALVLEILAVTEDLPGAVQAAGHYQAADILWDAYSRWALLDDLCRANNAIVDAFSTATTQTPLPADAHVLAARCNLALDSALRDGDQRREGARRAVEHAERAVALDRSAGGEVPMEHTYLLASALRLRGMLMRLPSDARDALDQLNVAKRYPEYAQEPATAAHVANLEGLCWKDLRDHDPAALNREVRAFEAAELSGRTERDDNFASMQRRNLANALVARAQRDGHEEDRKRAFALYRAAIKGEDLTPDQVEYTAGNWMSAAAAVGDWDEAGTAGEIAMDLLCTEAVRQSAPSSPDPISARTMSNVVLWPVGRIGRRVAEYRSLSGDLVGAVRAVERSRAVLVPHGSRRETMRAALPEDDVATREMIERVTAERDLCYLIDTGRDDCVAIHLSAGAEPRRHQVHFKRPLGELAARYLLAAQQLPSTRDYPKLENLLRQLATDLWADVLGAVVESTPADHQLAIVTTGRFAVLPLQVASSDPEAMTAQQRVRLSFPVTAMHLLDREMFHRARGASSGPAGDLLLLRPCDEPGGELPAVEDECAAVTSAWPSIGGGGKVLTARNVGEAVAALPGVAVVHAACHAYTDLKEPFTSSLQMSDGALSVTRLLTVPMRADLAFLSACSTAAAGIDLPEEAVGLAGTLEQAGVTAVVSSSWPVVDDAAAAVAVHFYEHLLKGAPPDRALRDAQTELFRGDVITGELSARHLAGREDRVRSMRGWRVCWNAFRYAGP